MANHNLDVVFSGIQPTGHLTLGNYLGAIKQWVGLQNNYECIFCIVDLHSITLPQQPETLKNNIALTIATYIASGIDPENTLIFAQSTVPQHTELGWILGCSTPLGWLNRMTQFKDKVGKHKESAPLGLYAYPALMAADILLYHAALVPVGEDQIQHLELTRDVAAAFNRQFNTEYFKLPKAKVDKTSTRIMSLKDGTKKMSKSDPSDSTRINLTDDTDTIARKIKKAKTDAIEGIYYDKENRPEISNLLNIYCSINNTSPDDAVRYFEGMNNAQFKEILSQALIEMLNPITTSIKEIAQDKTLIHNIIQEGSKRAIAKAEVTVKEVKEIVGLA